MLRWPPRAACPACLSMSYSWVDVGGSAVVFSWCVVHRTNLPALASLTPYVVLAAQLDSHPHIKFLGNLDGPREGLSIGAPLVVTFNPISPQISLPWWRLS